MKMGSLSTLSWQVRLTFIKAVPFKEDDFKCKGTKFQIIKFSPHTDVKPHYHKKRTEMFYVIEGEGIIKINGEEYRVNPNDFFLCEVNDLHQFINDTDTNFIVLVFRTNEPKEDDLYWQE